MILNQLPLEDKIRYRKVSMKFLDLIDKNSKSLLINTKYNKLVESDRWFDNGERFDLNNILIYKNDQKIFENIMFGNRFFERIKRVYLFCPFYGRKDKKITELDFLNCFNRMETLDLRLRIHNNEAGIKGHLKLPYLKNLHINQHNYKFHQEEQIIFDTPNLTALYLNSFNQLEFVYPEKIKHINGIISIMKLKLNNFRVMDQFVNLEYFEYEIDRSNDIKAFLELIKKYKKLKKLNLKTNERTMITKNFKKYFEFNSITVYINDILIDRWNEHCALNRQRDLTNDEIQFILDNYTSIRTLPNFNSIDYNLWEIELLNQCVPDDFQNKLINLWTISVKDQIIRADYFIEFIKKCQKIGTLELNHSSLDNSFYSSLNFNLLPFIHTLKITDNFQIIKQIDFKFIYDLKNLSKLLVDYPFDLTLLRNLFLNNKNLKEIRFLSKKESNKKRFIYTHKLYSKYNLKLLDDQELEQFSTKLTEQFNEKFELNGENQIVFSIFIN